MTTRLREWTRADDGRIAILVLVMGIGVLIMIGLAVDGGAKARALARADNIAAEAARAGGQAINLDQAATGGAKVVDPAEARTQTMRYLADAGVTGTVTPADGGRRLHVDVSISFDTTLLSLIGVGSMTVTGSADAQLLTG